MKYLLVPIRDIHEQGWLKVSDLYKSWLCCHRGITYSADLSGKDAKMGRAGWAAREVACLVLVSLWEATGAAPPGCCEPWGSPPRGSMLPWEKTQLGLFLFLPFVVQLSCFTPQIFWEALLLLIKPCLGTDVWNLKTERPIFTFKTKYFSVTFSKGAKEASNGGNPSSRFHCPHWQQCSNRLILAGISSPLRHKRVHSFHFSPSKWALCEWGFSPCHSWAWYHIHLYPGSAVLPCCFSCSYEVSEVTVPKWVFQFGN